MAGRLRRRLTGARIRRVFKAELAVANDPEFDEDVFQVRFPPGYIIQDKRTGVVFPSGPDPEKLAESLDKMAADVELFDATFQPSQARMPATTHPFSDRKATTAPGMNQVLPSSHVFAWAGAGAVLVALLAISLVIVLKKRIRAGTLVLLLAMSSSARVALAQDGAGIEMPYVLNCGVNLTYMTLKLLHRDVPLTGVATELGAGPTFARNCSLGEMKRVFEDHGLRAEGYKADLLEEAAAFFRPGTAIVVRKTSMLGHQHVGHFVMAWSGAPASSRSRCTAPLTARRRM